MVDVYHLMVYPQEAVYRLSREKANNDGFLILILSCVSITCGSALISGMSSRILLISLTWGMLMRFFAAVLGIYAASAFYHFFATCTGGTGDALKFFKVLPFSAVPFTLFTPICLFIKAFSWHWAGPAMMAAVFILLLWTSFLQIEMISYFYGIPSGQSVTVFLMPWIISFGAVAAMIIMLGIGAMFIFI